jgi:two-component system cell cycle sensor histidine kinase/response regulator CckA
VVGSDEAPAGSAAGLPDRSGGRPSPWRRLELWLIEPASAVTPPEDRSRCRLLAAMALTTITAAACVEAAFWSASRDYTWAWYLHAMFAGGYILGRRGHVRSGALLLAYALPVNALIRVGTGVAFSPMVPLTTLVFPPLVAGILLTRFDVVLLLAVEMALPLALVALLPAGSLGVDVVAGPMALTFAVGVLVLAFMRHRDTLERLRQQDLRAREQHLQALIANVPGVVYRATSEGVGHTLTYVSGGVRALVGSSPEDLLRSGRMLDDLVHADDRERVREERRSSLRDRGSYSLEYRLTGAPEGVRWVLDRGRSVRDEIDSTDCVDGILIDVTTRVAALAEKGRLASIVEATSDLVATAHADGRLLFMNPAGRRLLGWGHEEDVSLRRIPETHPPWASEIVERVGIPTAITQGVWAGETAVLDSRGHEVPVSQVIMAHRSTTGRLEFLSTIMRDLTERATADAARKESEERFRLLASAAFEGIAVTTQGRVADANEQLCAMLGLERAQLVGREVMEFVAPESRPLVLEHLRKGSEEPYEHLALRADGSVFPVEIRARTIPSAGRPQRVTALRDLTERKRAEEERVALDRRAQHSQKLESLGVLAGGIAHDFNNLLVAVLGNLDLATVGMARDASARHFLDQAEHAARLGAELARELLAYSGRGRFVVRPIDLSAMVDGIRQLLRAAIHKTIRLETHLEPALAPVMGDASQLQQVVMNLIVNAAEAIGERPGTITLTTGVEDCDADLLERNRLAVKTPPGRFARIEVRDDGCGMTTDVQERLFDPFFSTKLAGRGLGMAAVQGIVQGHGGAILVDSVPGRGTAFRVYLPVAGTAADAEAEVTSAPAVSGHGIRIERGGLVMVVDDEPVVRETSSGMLEHLGFSVVTAVGGREAVELFRRVGDQVTFVLLDLTMPDMDGLATLAELRRLRHDLKVVLASGFDETAISERCGTERPDGFLQKPYRLDTLEKAVEAALLG